MATTTVADRLEQVLRDNYGESFTMGSPDDKLSSMITDFDSLDAVEVLMAVEDEFVIELDDAALTRDTSFTGFAAMIEEKAR